MSDTNPGPEVAGGEELARVLDLADEIMRSPGITARHRKDIHAIFRPTTQEAPIAEIDLKEETDG